MREPSKNVFHLGASGHDRWRMKWMNWTLVEGNIYTQEGRDMSKVKKECYFTQYVFAQFYTLFYNHEPKICPDLVDLTFK